MISHALWWLFFNLLATAFLAFYSMVEMACVSFNKVRLQYYVYKGDKRAKWLHYLLDHPFRLFGTTLIGVNVGMVAGSECAREFHSSLGLSPDLAPLSQVAFVVVFGELAPMFAARHYAEDVAMIGSPLVYASARLLTPILWVIGWMTRLANLLFKGQATRSEFFLSKEELQKILEEKGDPLSNGEESQEFNVITRNIFSLRHKTAADVMTPLQRICRLPSHATIAQMKNIVKRTDANSVMIYTKQPTNIVGIAFPRDLLRVADGKRVRDYSRAPWFVTEKTPLATILHQFQRNNKSVAVILDNKGKAKGVFTLDELVAEIFGETRCKPTKERALFFLERTFAGDMQVKAFHRQFGVLLDKNENLTLSQLMHERLARHPEEGDSIYIDPFELIAKETSLLDVKSVIVKSR